MIARQSAEFKWLIFHKKYDSRPTIGRCQTDNPDLKTVGRWEKI